MNIFKRRKGKIDIKIKPREKKRVFRRFKLCFRSKKPEIKKQVYIKPPAKPEVKPEIKNIKIKRERGSLFRRFKLSFRSKKPEIDKEIKKEEKPVLQVKKPELGHHYMKRNVNFSLFFLIVIVLIALAGLTTYYQMTYSEQANNLKQKTEEFTTALNELQVKKVQLNQTSVQLQVESQSKEQLSGLYTSIKQEKEIVEADLTKTKDTLLATLSELESTKNELFQTQKEREQYKREAQEWKDEAKNFENQLDDCRSDLSSCQSRCPP